MHVGKKGLKLKAGWNHLDGNRALAFARTRHTDSDYQRAARQQQLIMATIGKVLDDRQPEAIPALAATCVLTMSRPTCPSSALPVLVELAEPGAPAATTGAWCWAPPPTRAPGRSCTPSR